MTRRPKNPKCNALQIEHENVYKELAAIDTDSVKEGKSELERIGLENLKSIHFFIRIMIHLLKISASRPATRDKKCAYHFVGEQLITNKDFRDKFYKTRVNDDETKFIIDGEVFCIDYKFNTRLPKSNLKEEIKKCNDKIESLLVRPNETGDDSYNSMNSHTTNEIESDTRPVEIGSCIEDVFWNSVSSDFNFSDESDQFDGLYTY